MGFQSRIKPKRSLGQNFFVNKSLAQHITDLVKTSCVSQILEIGPGSGSFTENFYGTTEKLVLIEKDDTLVLELEIRFPKADIIHADFLDVKLPEKDITYFGSLPYNVSKPIIKKILTSDTFTQPAFFIIQKEVADKYTNRDRNILGLIKELYADCKVLLTIKPENFSPRPKVMSAFIKFTPHNRYPDVDKIAMEKLIIEAFKQPRKTLKNNLKNTKYILNPEEETLRPDKLNIEQYISILKRS